MINRAVIALFVIVPAFAQNDFPDGPARESVQKICLQCHQAMQLLSQHHTETEWKQIVARMAQKRGVLASSDEFDAIAVYMAKNFGKTEDPTKLNMNKAAADQIADVIGLTLDEAKALVTWREKHGEFREWKEMLIVYGVDGRKLEAAKEKMTF